MKFCPDNKYLTVSTYLYEISTIQITKTTKFVKTQNNNKNEETILRVTIFDPSLKRRSQFPISSIPSFLTTSRMTLTSLSSPARTERSSATSALQALILKIAKSLLK
jgi:hypothetical protein